MNIMQSTQQMARIQELAGYSSKQFETVARKHSPEHRCRL